MRLVDESGFGALKTYFLANLARAHLEMGKPEDARRCAAEGLALARAIADATNVPGLLIVQAELARAGRQFDEACALLREAAQVTRSTQHRRWLVRCLMAFARVLAAARDPAGATRITLAIAASPAATATEISDARTLAGQLVADVDPVTLRNLRAVAHPSLDRLLAEIADASAPDRTTPSAV